MNNMENIKLEFFKFNENAVIPSFANKGDACMDLTATSRIFDQYGNVSYGTGIGFNIPEGYEIEIRPRSSISKYKLVLVNSPATIDSGYKGEVILKFKPTEKLNDDTFVYKVGERIAQFKLNKLENFEMIETDQLTESERGAKGFGSSGL